MRVITPDKPSSTDMTTLIDELFGHVSRDVKEGASGPETFTLLLRRSMVHFDRVDTGEGYTRLHNFGVCTGTPFCDFSREFRVLVSGRRGVGSGSDGGGRAVPHVDAYIVPWFDDYGPEAVRFIG